MKLRITHKGLLLLLLPFAIETTLIGSLYALSHKAEEIAVELRQRNYFIQRINVLMVDAGIAWADILNRLSSARATNHYTKLTPAEFRAECTKELANLRSIPLKSNRISLILSNVQELCSAQSDCLKGLEENSDSFGDLIKIQTLMNEFKSLRVRLRYARNKFDEIKVLLSEEQSVVNNQLEAERYHRELLKKLLLAGFMMQLLLMAILLFLFSKDITNRLHVLVKNARILPTGEKLSAYVGGSDEIAYLDNVLHDASKRLTEAAQNRQLIMNMIAHDIRTPLTSSNILVERLLKEVQESDNGFGTAMKLKNTFSQLHLLVEDLLILDKLESGTLSLSLDLFELKLAVDEAIDTTRPIAEKRGITFENTMPNGEVVADRGRILQVLNNLISNAVKYSPKNGVIEVRGEFKEQQAIVSVVDSGRGIRQKDLPFVFDKFFQADSEPAGLGFGLGLAISKMIISAHHGSLGVESVEDKGSTFWFSLPVDETV